MQKETTKRKKEMYSILRNWRKSSLSLKEYGQKHGINYGIMKYWNRQFRVDFPESKKPISKKKAIFIPVEVSDSIKDKVVSKTVSIEIHYPNGVFLQCPSDICKKELKTLITLF
ncbi:IS66 family insertion sequence element accessory protein TnpA [Aquimarina aggregata]|uniref:IS66 family insertion sequence element accessory protein TnpA n=1 Tax=Aquimarina aggregata TaxID=1642818 RepID=UPI00249219C3|nr:hypothetical protein [Aquimarina aggregata]